MPMVSHGHLEYLDIDRETISTSLTPNSIAVRFVNTSEVGMYGGHVQYGQWEPTENAVVVAGYILHKKEFEANSSNFLSEKIKNFCSNKLEQLDDELEEKNTELSDIKQKINILKHDIGILKKLDKSVQNSKLLKLISLTSDLKVNF